MKKTMLDYIHQTPAVLEKLLRDSETQTAALTDLLCSRPWRILRLVASGSSGNAAWCARPMLRRLLGMEVLVTPPHSFVHHENTPADDELVLVISQSGYSTNALAALELLAAYPAARPQLTFAAAHLYLNISPDSRWDLGTKANDRIYFPLSDSWRSTDTRKADCTERIRRFLDKIT